MYTCTKCNKEVRYLNIERKVTLTGKYDLDSESVDLDSSDCDLTTDDEVTHCPECGAAVDPYRDISTQGD